MRSVLLLALITAATCVGCAAPGVSPASPSPVLIARRTAEPTPEAPSLLIANVRCQINDVLLPPVASTLARVTNTSAVRSPQATLVAVYVSESGEDVYEAMIGLDPIEGAASENVILPGPTGALAGQAYSKVSRCDVYNPATNERTKGIEYSGAIEIRVPIDS